MGGKSFPIQGLGARSSSEPGMSAANSVGTFDMRIYRARIPIAAAREERLHLTTAPSPMRGMERPSSKRMWARLLGRLAALAILAVAYSIAGKLGLRLAVVHASATAVWPPTGLALAALLVRGYRVWPSILLGAFLVNVTTAGSVGTSIGIAVGNTLEAILGAYLVRRFANGPRDRKSTRLNSSHTVISYAVFCLKKKKKQK